MKIKPLNILKQLFLRFVKSKRAELYLEEEQKCMLDVFKARCTQRVFDLIDENHCVTVFVPANLTHVFQPLDLAINGAAKLFLKSKFSEWYSREISKALDKGQDIH